MKILAALALSPFLVACGGSSGAPKTPAQSDGGSESTKAEGDATAASEPPSPQETASDKPEPVAEETGLPTRCSNGSADAVCLPPAFLARGLCNEDYPTIALAMFAHGTPWTRGYSVTTSAAWNASGGASSNEKMNMYEEILVLRRRGADMGGMQVSGAGNSYDVLRWDGSCVTLQEGEFTFQKPAKITSARVVVKRLELHVREALKDAEELSALHRAHRKECKGVTMGSVSRECEKLDGQLSKAVAEYVREKGGVPEPHKLPRRR